MAVPLSLPRIAPTTYSLSQLFKDLSSAASSYFLRSDLAFRRVVVNKLDEQGFPRTITFTNLQTKEVTTLGPEFSFIENIKTGQIYYDESAFVLMVKCMAIFFAVPFYTLGVMLWNVHQIFRSIKVIALNVFHAARGDFVLGRYFDAAQILDREIKSFPGILKERIFEIIKAPLYGLGLQLAALSGILRPFHGRQFVSLIEKSWHNGATYKDDVWRVILKHKEIDSACWEDMHGGKEMFLAYCFQERGNVRQGHHFHVLRHESL